MGNRNIKTLSLTAFFTVLILLATSVLKFSTGMGEGYIHLGDCFIYLSACLLPFPYGIIAGAIGGALADVISGFAIWSIPTAIIKALVALPFMVASKNESKILTKKTAIIPLFSGIISVLGYFVTECILYSPASATLSILGNVIQSVASGILFLILAAALDKVNFKRRINNG